MPAGAIPDGARVTCPRCGGKFVFARGGERLALLLGDKRQARHSPAPFVAALGDAAQGRAFVLMHQMQRQGLRVEIDYQGRSLKAQMRRADKLAAPLVLIIGEDELARGVGQLRLMADSSQREVALAELYETVVAELAAWSGAGQCP
jgi:histidyl-tRNA synthetase